MSKYNEFFGKDVEVVSGPHEGRAGRILEIRDVSIGGREPEGYALIEFTAKNCFNEIYSDQISVPIRRVALR